MVAGGDDDVVVQREAELAGRLGELAGHLDVGAAGRRVAARVVVDEDQGRGLELQGALDDLARVAGVWSTVPLCWRSSASSRFLRSRNSRWKRSTGSWASAMVR